MSRSKANSYKMVKNQLKNQDYEKTTNGCSND